MALAKIKTRTNCLSSISANTRAVNGFTEAAAKSARRLRPPKLNSNAAAPVRFKDYEETFDFIRFFTAVFLL